MVPAGGAGRGGDPPPGRPRTGSAGPRRLEPGATAPPGEQQPGRVWRGGESRGPGLAATPTPASSSSGRGLALPGPSPGSPELAPSPANSPSCCVPPPNLSLLPLPRAGPDPGRSSSPPRFPGEKPHPRFRRGNHPLSTWGSSCCPRGPGRGKGPFSRNANKHFNSSCREIFLGDMDSGIEGPSASLQMRASLLVWRHTYRT